MLRVCVLGLVSLSISAQLGLGAGKVVVSERTRPADPKQDDEFLYGTFPDGFLWGFATASYQIEGGNKRTGNPPRFSSGFNLGIGNCNLGLSFVKIIQIILLSVRW